MSKVFLTLLIAFIYLGAFAQNGAGSPKKVFAIHNEKREMKHEYKGKHHDFRKNHPKHSAGHRHPHKQPKHKPAK